MITKNSVTGANEQLLSNSGRLLTGSADLGAMADASASTDTGTFSLIALTKRMLGKMPSLGQAVMTGSTPVVIASNQSAVSVAPAAGTNLIGDVGIQVRANATGAATVRHLVSLATTNLTNVKNGAGRVYGWSFANTTAAWVYLKLHNSASAPTAGAGVYMTIALPPNGKSEMMLPAGISFSVGIGFSTVTGAADTDTVAVGANAIVGDLLYA